MFLLFLFSLPCDPPTTHPEGLSRRGSRGEALAPLRPTRDPPVTHPEGLSRRGSRGWGSRGQALADGLCDPPATHPEGLSWRGYRGRALAEESCKGLSRIGLSRTNSRGRARKKTTALPTPRLPHPLTLIGKCRVIGICSYYKIVEQYT